MRLDYYIKGKHDHEDYWFATNADLPAVGQIVDIKDARKHRINYIMKCEIIRIDHSIILNSKPFCEVGEEYIQDLIERESFTSNEQEKLIGGHVFEISHYPSQVAYSQAFAKIILKEIR